MDNEQAPSYELTSLLRAWRDGEQAAREELVTIVYPQLRALAARYMQAENSGNTLSATALVHEAYLKMLSTDVPWEDRVHFFAVCARVMRQILVDHARAHRRVKRGGDAPKLSLDEAIAVSAAPQGNLLDLDRVLTELAQLDARKAELVELVYFGGLSHTEAAAALKVSESTVQRELRLAKAWIYRALSS